jgi:hypothetical protein
VRNLRGRVDAKGRWQADARALLALAEDVLVARISYHAGKHSIDYNNRQNAYP